MGDWPAACHQSLRNGFQLVAALPGGRMHGLLSALGRGFKKWIGWKRLGIAASLLIIAFAITTLVRTLKGVDTGVILTALTEIPPGHIALAALCVIGAFCTLTFYDFFALRTIGQKHVPYRIAALSSFTSYTIGHNIGATVFTGGAIRFRIYSDYGLSAIDVAKICFLSGLTFWLGNTFVLGIGMAWHPWAASAMDQLPSAINRLIALGGIAAIIAYLVWLTLDDNRRELGQNGWKVVLPSAPLTLVQILIGVVDLGFCAMAMYLLMPAQPGIDFISLAVVFILATLLGFASHAPGSIGVFDAAMLVALPEFGREQLLATLVVFRILYFVIPFATAISIIGARELWLNVVVPWQERRRLNETFPAPAAVPQPLKDRQAPPVKRRQSQR
jgi:glycosyltransferase 2 family protein